MAVAYKDFVPLPLEVKFFGGATYETLDAALERANAWMAEAGARVINIETVVLPNLHPDTGTAASGLRTSGDISSYWHQVIRVWYEADEPPVAENAPPPLT